MAIGIVVVLLSTMLLGGDPWSGSSTHAGSILGKGLGLDVRGHAGSGANLPAAGTGAYLGLRTVASDPLSGGTGVGGPTGPSVGPLGSSPRATAFFRGMTKADHLGTSPLNPQIAVAGSYVMEMVDDHIRITGLTGVVMSSYTTQSALGTPSTDILEYSQLLYDNLSHRWIYSILDVSTNVMYFAVSHTSSPVGSWYFYSYVTYFLGRGAQFMDQSLLGVTKTMVGIGQDIYNVSTTAFLGSICLVLSKSAIESGTFTHQFLAAKQFQVVPARQITTNGSGTDVFYWATTGTLTGSGSLTVYDISGTIGSLTSTSVTWPIMNVGTGGVLPEPDPSAYVEHGTGIVRSVGWASGNLWVAIDTVCTPAGDGSQRSCVRVDAISTGGNSLSQDTDTGVAGDYLYFGALTPLPSGAGYYLIVGVVGNFTYPSIAISGQAPSDPYGSFRGPFLAVGGFSSDYSGDFGVYFGIQIDFAGSAAAPLAWGVSQIDVNGSEWATEIVHFGF